MLIVVTHHVPDLDAVTSVWLIKRFLPNWQDAEVKYVPSGDSLDGQIVDNDPKVLHVDTGFGMLDHHQSGEFTCAAKKTYVYIKKIIGMGQDSRFRGNDKRGGNGKKRGNGKWHDEALERMSEVICFYDHFKEANLPDATADYQLFSGTAIFDGLRSMYAEDEKIMEAGFLILDAIYKNFKERIWAEEILGSEGIKFATIWGKGVAFETINDAVLKLAQKSGFMVVVRKDPKKGYVRIKGMPDTKVDFTAAYEKLKGLDPQATWFLHSSRKILLNGTTKNPEMKPTRLSLEEIIKVLKK